MIALLDSRLDEIADLCRRHSLRRLEVFGSAARETDFGPASDIDLLVDYGTVGSPPSLRDFFRLRDGIIDIVGRPVDLVMSKALENPFLCVSVERSKRPLYGA